jgi:adenylate cyclase
LIEKGKRLNPQYPAWYIWDLGHAYYLARRYEEAIATLKRMIIRNPNFMPAHAYLCVIYTEQGRTEEAKAEGIAFLLLTPQFSLDELRKRLPYKDLAVLERVLAGARAAGLK